MLTFQRAGWGSAVAVSRFWYVLHKTTAPPTGVATSGDIECRLATIDDRRSFSAFTLRRPADELAAWVREEATWVFVAFAEGRAVAYDCVTRHLPRYPPFSAMRLAADEVWVRDAYTVPELRQRRLGRTVRAYRNAAMRALGVRRTLSATAEDNVASLVAGYDGAMSKVDGLAYRRVLCFRHVRYHEDVRARLDALVSRVRGSAAVRAPATLAACFAADGTGTRT